MTHFSIICSLFLILSGVVCITDMFDNCQDNTKAVIYSLGIVFVVFLCVAVILGVI